MARKMAPFEISHNDIGVKDRGVWRKYNPYNPYVEEKDEKAVENLKVESLDDLFEDLPSSQKEKVKSVPESQPELGRDTVKSEVKPDMKPTLDLEDFKEEAPMLPQDTDEEMYDLQKELEAKFDELFGPIDE